MLSNLNEYEEKFRKQMSNISLLSDIEISRKELKDMADLIKFYMQKHDSKYWDKYKLTISLLLVWVGVYEYQEGNYWDYVDSLIGVDVEQVLRDIFWKTLNEYNLPTFYEGKGKRYINSILAHGSIPEYYLDDFFEKFLHKFYRKELNFELNKEKVKKQLEQVRQDYKEHEKLVEENDNLEKLIKENKNNLQHFRSIFDNRDKMLKIVNLRKKLICSAEMSELIRFPKNYLEQLDIFPKRI